ncbi:MAG: cyclic nucleotide-binding domain-containing protein [Candidatus Ozemobacteraceae bacterium]
MFALKGFSESDFATLRKFMETRIFKKNEIIVKTGQPAQALYFVEEGSVKLVQRTAIDHGDDVVVGSIREGGFFGEESLLRESQISQETAVALDNSVLLSLTQTSLQKLMAESITIGTKLLVALSKNYREALTVPEKMAKILVFYSPKGGAGCTTIAVNTAWNLSRSGKKVVYIDADLQFGNAGLLVGMTPGLSVARLIQSEEVLVFDRVKHFLDKRYGIDFLYSPVQPQEAELVSRNNLQQIIKALGSQYDLIVIDSACEIDEVTMFVWDIADCIHVVSQGNISELTRVHRLLKVFDRLNYKKEKVSALVNRFQESQMSYFNQFQKLAFGMVKTFANCPEENAQAMFEGVPVAELFPGCTFSKNVRELTAPFLGESVAPQERTGGIFSRVRNLFTG